jgi:hypothetical protein
MKYTIYAAMPEDINVGWVWIGSPRLASRIVVRITNKKSGNSSYCEALQIEDNFLRIYNDNGSKREVICDPGKALVLNAWYRRMLDRIETQSEYDLEIEAADNLWGRLRSCLQHPQVVVRLATWLGIFSVGLGVMGLLLGLGGLWIGLEGLAK